MTFTVIFVRDVPGDDGFVVTIPLGKFFVNGTNLLPIHRRGEAVVVAATDMLPIAQRIHPKHFGVFFCQPAGTCAGGSSQNHLATGFADFFNNGIQQGKIIVSLSRFQSGPGEDADGHFIAVCLLHQFHIPIPNVGRPLLRIVVRAVDHMGKAGAGVLLVFHSGSSGTSFLL